MNNCKLLAICTFTIFASACNSSVQDIEENSAEVILSLNADNSHRTKADAEESLPSIEDFTVEIFKKATGARLYRDTYSNAKDTKIRLNAGDYKLVAFYGDSLGAGFSSAYYQALVPFTIDASQRRVNVSGTAKLANTKVAVNYGEMLKTYYTRFCTSVFTDKENVSDSLGFSQTETRAGFIPAGTLTVNLYAALPGEKMKYYHTTVDASPNDFITLNLETSPQQGKISIGIVIDNSVEIVEKEVEMDATDIATGTPEITVSDNLKAGTVEFYEGDDLDGTTVSVVSPAGFAHAWLETTSDYLKAKGIADKIDLCEISADTKAIFSGLGVQILNMGSNTMFSYIDFSGMKNKLKYESTPFEGSFKLTVEDKNGAQASSSSFALKMLQNDATLSVSEDNAFARSFRKVNVTVTSGKPENYTLQYRPKNGKWTAAEGAITGNSIDYEKISGITPGTEYEFRAIYNNNPDNSTDTVTVKSEDAAQVGNSDFENWTTETIKISVKLASDRTLDWYLPYTDASDAWWAVTSKKSMPTSIYATTKTSVKSFPTVAYSPDCVSGSRSAHIYTVNIGTFNTDAIASGTSYAGELFIGTADDSGNHSTDGHSFSSRPDKFKFKYKFAPKGSEKFYVKIEFKDASGNVLNTLEDTEGPSASDWTAYSTDFSWDNLSKKVANIYISFKSSSSSSPGVNAASTLEVAGNADTGGHFGSSLYVDDIELIYE